MVSEVLKPNVQDLQQDVIELLGEISSLMNGASTALSSDNVSQKYAEFEQQVSQEAEKVKNLELRMAIVAPMKAGKSTITNAIVGQEILPSRNAAMTTLPTEIIFDAELTKPVLYLSSEILAVFQETLLVLRDRIDDMGIEEALEKLAQYPHLAKIPKQIQKSVGLSIPAKSQGRDNIIHTLTSLNDIVRLCSILDPSADPLQSLMDVPRIRTPFWRSCQANQQSKSLGNLVIVDTPGPNEAGDNLRLQGVVEEQLSRSSIVLIVLDFTQLKNEAAEKVKNDVQKVIELRGKENLYVLINKVDQRRDGDMNPEQVQQFVAAEFGIGDAGRVFEISARRAFTSASFLVELQHNPGVNLTEMKTAKALAQEVFGFEWEEDFQKAKVEELQPKADKLWEKSGFDPFLNGAITVLMLEAAPLCMKSALKIACGRLAELQDDVKLRSSAIAQDEDKLRFEVDALEKDLQSLTSCRNRLQEIDKIRVSLEHNLNDILKALKEEAKVSIESYFDEEEKERASRLRKLDIKAREFFLTKISPFEIFPKWFSRRIKSKLEFKSSGLFEFNSQIEAEEFANHAVAWAKERADHLLGIFRKKIEKEIEEARTGLFSFLEQETNPIIDRARERLNQAFNIELSLPQPPKLVSDDMNIVKAQIKTEYRNVDQGYEEVVKRKRKFSHYLWLVPIEVKEKVKRPDKKEDYYTVSLEELICQINESIEKNVDNINKVINQYLDEDFQCRFDAFFQELNRYLSNYYDTLIQAQKDQKILAEHKEQLVSKLDSLALEASKKNTKADTSIKRTDDLRNKR